MRLQDFRRRWKNRRCSGYTSRGGQCIDLMREWLRVKTGNAYHGIPRIVAAKDIYRKADSRKWRKVRWNGQNAPPRGAIVVFARGRWGHVAIARARCTSRKLLTFDQNWSIKQRCTDEQHDYARDKVIGWLVRR